eukprot:TRINITY_DN14906_c0_g1_i5.p1 TRINITY_DN14906_c0_g1~~TRINITY_DN14906_c0_g1_i5.p1  ORF type:complete len:704 (-),score=97.60 TRINITY_DN14906_c0_g1_i5:125-2236(-)
MASISTYLEPVAIQTQEVMTSTKLQQNTFVNDSTILATKKLLDINIQKLDFKPREMSQIIWGLGKLRYDGTLDKIDQKFLDKSDKIQENGASANYKYSKWKLLVKYMMKKGQDQLDEFSLEDYGMLMHGLANLQFCNKSQILNILEKIRDHLYIFSETKQNCVTTVSSASVVSILWACGKLNIYQNQTDEILNLIYILMQRKMVQFGSSELTILAVACSRTQKNHQQLLNIVGKEAVQKLHMFSGQEIAQIVYAYGKLGVFNYDLFNKSAEILIKKNMSNFSTSQISQVAFAFQKIKFKQEDLAAKIRNSFSHRLNEFSSQELNNLLQFFSQNNLKDQNLLEKLKEVYFLRIGELETDLHLQIVSNFQKLGLNDSEIFEQAISVVKNKIKELRNDDIRRFLQIMSQANYYDESLFIELIELIYQKKLKNFQLYQIISIQQYLGAAGHFDEKFTQNCYIYFANNFDKLDPKNILNVCQIISKFRINPKKLEIRISKKIQSNLNQFSAGQLTNIIWTFYLLNHQDENFRQELSEKLSTFQLSDFSDKNLNLLFLIHLFCQQNNKQDFLWEKLDQQILLQAESKWKNHQIFRARQNTENVQKIWDEIKLDVPKKFNFKFSKQISDGSFVADICLESELYNKKIVIMFPGPNSFARNDENVAAGFQFVNDEVLKLLGWNVINVKYWEQNKAEFIKQQLINLNVVQNE